MLCPVSAILNCICYLDVMATAAVFVKTKINWKGSFEWNCFDYICVCWISQYIVIYHDTRYIVIYRIVTSVSWYVSYREVPANTQPYFLSRKTLAPVYLNSLQASPVHMAVIFTLGCILVFLYPVQTGSVNFIQIDGNNN